MTTVPTTLSYDEHEEQSREIQRRADKWCIAGTIMMGATIPGIPGLLAFLRGVSIQRKAQRDGFTVRPIIVTLIGYMIILDAALNTFGWALDLIANHSLIARTYLMGWGRFFDAGYYWYYNEIGIGGAGAPGEKAWEIACVLTVFPMRIAAGIGFLQMKRWGHQWMIITCWFGVVIWIGYVANMTIYADVRFTSIVLPVVGWWLFDIFYITPFLAIPYLHTVNREVFTD